MGKRMHEMTDHTMSEREAELQALPISDKQLDTTAERIKSRNRDSIVALEGAAAQLGARTIWSQATFQVTPGEFIAILGPNGAGKTTMLRVLLGLLRPSAGQIRVLGRSPRRGDPGIGYVPQRRPVDRDLRLAGTELVKLGLTGGRWGTGWPGRGESVARQVGEAVE